MTKPSLPTKTRVPGHKPSSLPRVDQKRVRVFPGAIAYTGPGTRARSSLSFLSVAREGKGQAEVALCDAGAAVYTLQTWCLSMCSSHTFADCGQGSCCGGPGEVPRPFIHAVWGQMVRSAGQTGVHRAR